MKKNTNPQNIIPPITVDIQKQNNYQIGTATFTPYNNLGNSREISGVDSDNQASRRLDGLDQDVERLVSLKQREYTNLAYRYRNIHYILLIIGSVFGVITPLIIPYFPIFAQIASAIVAIAIILEQTFKPKEKWTLYSKATDLIQLQLFKKKGAYEKNKELINTIINTEAQILNIVPGLNEVLKQVKNSQVSNKNT